LIWVIGCSVSMDRDHRGLHHHLPCPLCRLLYPVLVRVPARVNQELAAMPVHPGPRHLLAHHRLLLRPQKTTPQHSSNGTPALLPQESAPPSPAAFHSQSFHNPMASPFRETLWPDAIVMARPLWGRRGVCSTGWRLRAAIHCVDRIEGDGAHGGQGGQRPAPPRTWPC